MNYVVFSAANRIIPFGEEEYRINRRVIKYCECGCGAKPSKGKRFLVGHNNQNKTPWNKGKKASKESIEKMKGNTNAKGYKHTKEECRKISKSKRGKPSSFMGKKHSKETRSKMSKAQKERLKIETNHPNWQGGLSKEEYGLKWTNQLKEKIRKRDNHTCQCCGKKDIKKKLDVHHIDYDKKNNNEDNLITLCRSCHIKTNYDREEWLEFFEKEDKIKRRVC